jgi:hypothetical protein
MNILESVYDLIEFALAFQSTMHRFNEALLNFAFELRMGCLYREGQNAYYQNKRNRWWDRVRVERERRRVCFKIDEHLFAGNVEESLLVVGNSRWYVRLSASGTFEPFVAHVNVFDASVKH